jgi:hypothetical protein
VPLAVDETAGVARRAWPAAASVPLPRGRVSRPEATWLATRDGRAAPAQMRALERWPDGSVRWLLVDFLADVAAGGKATYTLRDDKAPAAGDGPRIRAEPDGEGGGRVDTGVLRATVPARGGAWLTEVAVGDVRPGPIALPTLAVDGAPAAPPTRERVTLETEGPVRTELLATGRYPQGMAWELRIAAFAGQPFLRLRHSLTNVADAHYAPVRSLALALPGRFTSAALGVDGGERTIAPLDAAHELVHLDAMPALLDGARAGRHADGWARASGGGIAVTVVGRDFWQEYPKAIRVAPDRLAIDLFAGRDAPIQFGSGAAKTHEVWVALEPEGHATPPADLAAALAAPRVALPAAEWIVASRALPQALDPRAPGARDFLARLATAYARYRDRTRTEEWDDGLPIPCEERRTEHRRVGLYGLFTWGDWQFPGYRDHVRGCDGWGNLEYDLPQVLGLAWVATGSRAFYDGFLASARHYRDVDVIHHAPGHPTGWGSTIPQGAPLRVEATEEDRPRPHVDRGAAHRPSPDGRATHARRRAGHRRRARRPRGAGEDPRQFGWPMLALAALYDATGEAPVSRRRARAYADAAVRAFRPRPPPGTGRWASSPTASRPYAASGDDGLKRWLVTYADTLVGTPGKWTDPRFALRSAISPSYDDALRGTALAVARRMPIGEWEGARVARADGLPPAPLATRAGLRPSPPPSSRPRPPASTTPGRALSSGVAAHRDDRHRRDQLLPGRAPVKSARTSSGPISRTRKRSALPFGACTRYSAPTASRGRAAGGRAAARTSSGRHSPNASSAGMRNSRVSPATMPPMRASSAGKSWPLPNSTAIGPHSPVESTGSPSASRTVYSIVTTQPLATSITRLRARAGERSSRARRALPSSRPS